MQRKLHLIAIMTGSSLLLSACGFNPQNSAPTKIQQCNTLQRQMLFGNEDANGNPSGFQRQASRTQIQQQYNKMHCYQTLQEAKATRDQK
ncbi:MAG: hypothetical protein COV52_00270 [Gammaproteobacteria bacterium CG11_big_fil_rev_8_21_14_0_20_46_22]|nr:MAG: hypothetical protein COW05_09235 [Gammaproteobacteria bacterium CG12_big_fil_rev_8_21_14_0_65_46_12]PIR12094.1 MAG: hypothetical protein COV52_00270 [Gammaproteobacteria bacterium CG11_big_fil_rev_8_21_14_0_20_46_22]